MTNIRMRDIKEELVKLSDRAIRLLGIPVAQSVKKEQLRQITWENYNSYDLLEIVKYISPLIMRAMLSTQYNAGSVNYLMRNYPNQFFENIQRTRGRLQKIDSRRIHADNRLIVWRIHEPINSPRGYCTVCGVDIDINTFECGHILARANGGTNDSYNLAPVCRQCNMKMGTKSIRDFSKGIIPSRDIMHIDADHMFLFQDSYPILSDWRK